MTRRAILSRLSEQAFAQGVTIGIIAGIVVANATVISVFFALWIAAP